jgi:hypothetical protein
VPEVDDDQLAALRRLRIAFGPIEVVEVVNHDPDDDLPAARAKRCTEVHADADEPANRL